MTAYNDMLALVADYYGSGSDQWVKIASGNFTASEFASILRQTPGVDIVTNAKGELLSYTVSAQGKSTLATNIGSLPNSNTAIAEYGAGSSLTTRIPANTGLSATNKVTAQSGLASAGNFVMSSVIPAIAAAGVGITLGKTIDAALYNANPDFWDANGLSSLNPETWGSITEGVDGISANLFNMVFGIDDSTGKTQAYLDQNALAYLALYMQKMGTFSTSSNESGAIDINSTFSPTIVNDTWNEVKNILPLKFTSGGNATRYNHQGVLTRYFYSNAKYKLKSTWTSTDGTIKETIHLISDEPFTITETDTSGGDITTVQSSTMTATYIDTEYTYYYYSPVVGYPNHPTDIPENYYGAVRINFSGWIYPFIYATIIFQGDIQGGALPGVRTQTWTDPATGETVSATTPDLSTIDTTQDITSQTVQDVLDLLQQQFPDIFVNKVTNEVVQPDGQIITYVYVPIGLPDIISTTDIQPTITTQTQQDTTVSPNTQTEPILDIITSILAPDLPVDPPDTGEGDTPPYVPPDGTPTALWSIYNPTLAQVQSFGAWLWSSNFVDQILKIFTSPMDAIITLHKIYATPITGSSSTIQVGYLNSGISSLTVTNQYVDVNCGSVDCTEFYGNALDYDPFTSIQIYLPFIGVVPLDTAEVMRSTITVTYHVDVFTGACLAEINILRDNQGGTLYTFTGNCAVQYPLSSGSYVGIVTGLIGACASLQAGHIGGAFASLSHAQAQYAHSGNFSANAGAMGVKKPYLIIRRPQRAMSNEYNLLQGNPSNYYTRIGACEGLIRVDSIQIKNLNATSEEIEELGNILTKGILV